MSTLDAANLERLLQALGDLLSAEGTRHAILVVGGAALILRRWVPRTTDDVDVLALAPGGDVSDLRKPDFPESLRAAIARVARDFGVSPLWCNAQVGMQWDSGLPDSMLEDIEWREFGGLRVGLAGRQALIAFKLFAAVDQGPASVHTQDLLALAPTDVELATARAWVVHQDGAPEFPRLVDEVLEHVRSHRPDRRAGR